MVTRHEEPAHGRERRDIRPPTAAASPALLSCAVFSRSSTASWMGWAPTGARAPTATWRPTTSSSHRPASKQGSSSSNGGSGAIQMPTIRSSGRSTRTTSGRTARAPVTSAIFARTVSSGSRSHCPPNIRLIDPATNAPSAETFVDVWRSVPTVNDVALTGPDACNPWLRGPNEFGGYQLDARVGTLQEQALGAFTNHAQMQNAPPQQLLDDLASFQRVLFTNHRVRALSDADQRGHNTVAGSRSAAQRARAAGQSGVRARLQPMPRRPRTDDSPRPRWFGFTASQPVPASRRHRDAGPLRVCGLPAAARAQCPDVRDYAVYSDAGPRRVLPAGTKIRRTSSDPGRALLTGFVGGPAPQDDWDKFDMPGLRGISKTAPYFHNNSAATLEEVVDHYIEFFKRVKVIAAAGCRATGREHRRRDLRPAADSRRAGRAPGVSAEAVARTTRTTDTTATDNTDNTDHRHNGPRTTRTRISGGG